MLIVGDSRVKEMAKQKDYLPHPGWRVECISQGGMGLDQAVQQLKDWKECYYPDRPQLVVMVSFLCDVLDLTSLPCGTRTLRLNAHVLEGTDYPALKGLEKKVREVEKSLRNWWGDLKIIWTIPYPADVRRWTTRKFEGDGDLSEKVIEQCHRTSFDLAKWLDEANNIGSRMFGKTDRVIPWFVIWNDRKKTDLNFDRFMKKMESEPRFGWINHWRSRDGIHPTPAVARQLLALLYRKIGQDSVSEYSGHRSGPAYLKKCEETTEVVPSRKPSPVPDRKDDVIVPECVISDSFCSSTATDEVGGAVGPVPDIDFSSPDNVAASPDVSEESGDCNYDHVCGEDCEKLLDPEDLDSVLFPVHLGDLSVVDATSSRDVLEDSLDTTNNEGGVPRVSRFDDDRCTGHGDKRASPGSSFYKISYPCGHTMPFTRTVYSPCTEEIICSVCRGRWSTANLAETSYHHFLFSVK